MNAFKTKLERRDGPRRKFLSALDLVSGHLPA
jgi:hypothetical protein